MPVDDQPVNQSTPVVTTHIVSHKDQSPVITHQVKSIIPHEISHEKDHPSDDQATHHPVWSTHDDWVFSHDELIVHHDHKNRSHQVAYTLYQDKTKEKNIPTHPRATRDQRKNRW